MSDRPSTRPAANPVPAPDPAPETGPPPFDPDDPFAGWDNASTARRVELLYEVVRRMHDRSRPG